MAWPLSRLTTYLSGITKVKGADLNAIQDQIIDLSNGVWATLQTFTLGALAAADQHFTVSGNGRFKHGDIPYQLSPFGGSEGTPGDFVVADGCIVASGGSGPGVYYKPLDFKRGERILSIGVRVGRATSEHWTAELVEATDGSEDVIDAASSSEGATSVQTITLTPPGSGLVIAEGFAYYLKMTRTAPSLDLRFYRAIPHVDQP